ncbi:hypothetical protein ABXT48_02415 [Candidatus Pelagibacter sp. Uisw_101]|uniref:hypothetical protein n=1 Tax=Candidatus Pelagibacter sp. Uisw_101 TaxID=3230982 RepID=UPI0039ED1DEE
MDRLLDPHTQKICDALLSDIINTVDNEETCTIRFFRKDLVTMTIWLFILKSYNEYKSINIEDIAREVAPSSRVSKPSLRLILENAKIKKFIRFVDNPKDNRSWIIEPEDITINEFKKWTQIFL